MTATDAPLVCGIDVGTSAVRAAVCDLAGRRLASSAWELGPVRADGPRREQDPEGWWNAVCGALKEVCTRVDAAAIGAVSVDATSGTIVLVDRRLRALTPGLLYNDGRAAGYGDRLNEAAGEFTARHGYLFKDNFSLAKMAWLRDHEPVFKTAHKALHQSDFINARLTGAVPATDWSNALKSGCDLFSSGWADFIPASLGFPVSKLPDAVVAPGTPIGEVCADAAAQTGLKPGTAVVAGASDGTAALFASGASQPGDFNTTLGSTLVLKGITREILRDPEGVVYCHRHPTGYWLPGGAGNAGCAPLDAAFAPEAATRVETLRRLDATANAHLPSQLLTYPLGDQQAERFPFRKSGIASFVVGTPDSKEALYAASLQAVAFIERWCYEKLERLGARIERLYSTGGGSKSAVWLQIRADVLQRPIHLPGDAETAMGAAVLAAAYVLGDFEAAAAALVRTVRCVEPGDRSFDAIYARFRAACREQWGVE